jgi:hypothetical protein
MIDKAFFRDGIEIAKTGNFFQRAGKNDASIDRYIALNPFTHDSLAQSQFSGRRRWRESVVLRRCGGRKDEKVTQEGKDIYGGPEY